jgi:hypothetical protein
MYKRRRFDQSVMSNFEILPPELFRMIIQFLNIPKELIRFDNAILNHRLRSFYHQTIDRMPIEKCRLTTRDSDIIWFLNKNIIPLEISIDHIHFNSLLLLERSRPILQSLFFYRRPQIELHFLGHFPFLTQFTLYSFKSSSMPSLIRFLELNPQLESLHFPDINSLSSELISGISRFSPNLKSLDVSLNRWFGDDCVSLLIQGGLSKLETLTIPLTSVRQHDSIVNILRSFPRLKCLDATFYNFSMETNIFYLNEYALPRLMSSDRVIQEIALRGFYHVLSVRPHPGPV